MHNDETKLMNYDIGRIKKKHIQQLSTKIFKKSNMFIVINGSDQISLDKINSLIDSI